MKRADEIRSHATRNYIEPARAAGQSQVSIRAGDVAREMGLYGSLPSIVSALGTLKFQRQASVELIRTEGPLMGCNAVLTFRLL